MLRTTLLALALLAAAAAPAAASGPRLEDRSILPADASWPAAFPAAPNTNPAPAPGARQPVGGFSALLAGPIPDTYLAMPDNGFGTKANSRSFLLRLYTVRKEGYDVEVLDAIDLRDPNHVIPFALVNGTTPERLLTGADFDVESVRIDSEGTLWFGDEFGPFLLHTDASGVVLEPPVPLPGVRGPDYPRDYPPPAPAANLGRSNGFEGMAISSDGRTLFPMLEGPLAEDADKTIRRMYTFDIATRSYVGGHREYHVADPTLLVSDLTRLDDQRFVSLERDNLQGPAAVHKKAFVVEPQDGAVAKREVLDELDIPDPHAISLAGPVREGDFGLGDPFKMPYQTIEAVLPLHGNRLAIVNDTNFGSMGRNPLLPDYSDFIVVKVPALRRSDQ